MSSYLRVGAALFTTCAIGLAVGMPTRAVLISQDPSPDAPRINDIPDQDRPGYGGYPEPNPPERRVLEVYGWIDVMGLHVQGTTPNSPTRSLKRVSDEQSFRLIAGDIIRRIDGTRIGSPTDYWNALRNAPDPNKIELEVRDARTGDDGTYYVRARVIH